MLLGLAGASQGLIDYRTRIQTDWRRSVAGLMASPCNLHDSGHRGQKMSRATPSRFVGLASTVLLVVLRNAAFPDAQPQ